MCFIIKKRISKEENIVNFIRMNSADKTQLRKLFSYIMEKVDES